MNNKIFIDTSVFIRFLTKDDPQKYEECKNIFALIYEGKLRPYISQIVILEIIFVLSRQYLFRKDRVLNAIDEIYALRNITVIEKTDTKKALELYSSHRIKYQDCLIATQLPDGVHLLTYDSEFYRIPKLKIKSPSQYMKP